MADQQWNFFKQRQSREMYFVSLKKAWVKSVVKKLYSLLSSRRETIKILPGRIEGLYSLLSYKVTNTVELNYNELKGLDEFGRYNRVFLITEICLIEKKYA